jgi:hypothetical protein
MRILLSVFLAACGVVGLLWALLAFASSKSAAHEIEALIGVLIVTVAVGAGYVGACVKRE